MHKVIIVGGGVSGVCSAILLKRRHPDLSVQVIEQNNEPLKKLLATGSGRCNLSNKNMDIRHYDTDGKKLTASIIDSFDDQKELKQLGLYTKYMGNLLYPVTEQAKSVKKVLLNRAKEAQVVFCLGETVTNIYHQNHYIIETDQNIYQADVVILAIGSAAGGMSGTNDRQQILTHLHQPFHKMMPMLVPMTTRNVDKSLKGLRMKGHFTLTYHDHILGQEDGEMLFTDYGVSGIAIMNLSRFYKKGVVLQADLLPEVNKQTFAKALKSGLKHPLDGLLPQQMAQLIEQKKVDPVHFIKDYKNEITGLREMKYAQAAKGGLSLKGFDENLESVYETGLFACGEILNTTGDCGGFNLHFAFASAKRVVNGIERKYYA